MTTKHLFSGLVVAAVGFLFGTAVERQRKAEVPDAGALVIEDATIRMNTVYYPLRTAAVVRTGPDGTRRVDYQAAEGEGPEASLGATVVTVKGRWNKDLLSCWFVVGKDPVPVVLPD